MKETIHPSHNRVWINLVVILILLSCIPFGLGLSIHDPVTTQQPVFDALVALFMILLGGAGKVGLLGNYLGKCPECKNGMRRYRPAGGVHDRIRFVCPVCGIIYDTGVDESTD